MSDITILLEEFKAVSDNPQRLFRQYLDAGKKVVGVMPYFCPEELVIAAGMLPFGLWGADITASESKRYYPAFICSILHTILELGITGAYRGMSAVMVPISCDSLKCMGTNWEYGVPDIPVISLAHAQNRKLDAGIEFTAAQYRKVREELHKHGGKLSSDAEILDAIRLKNRQRRAVREFIRLAGKHPETVSALRRSAVIKSAYFMEVREHTDMLEKLNGLLAALPESRWDGLRIVTSGIIMDSPDVLEIFDDNKLAIAADQVTHESVGFSADVSEDGDPIAALAKRIADIEGASVLYDPGKYRATQLADIAAVAGADGVIFVLTKFCDPEEYDFVPVKRQLQKAGIPLLQIEVDRQTKGVEQIRSAVEAFCDVIRIR